MMMVMMMVVVHVIQIEIPSGLQFAYLLTNFRTLHLGCGTVQCTPQKNDSEL
jgi:hypothetical protein